MGPNWIKNGKKGYFNTSHLIPYPVFPTNKVFHSSPDTKEEIFSVGLLKSALRVLSNQANPFFSRGIG